MLHLLGRRMERSRAQVWGPHTGSCHITATQASDERNNSSAPRREPTSAVGVAILDLIPLLFPNGVGASTLDLAARGASKRTWLICGGFGLLAILFGAMRPSVSEGYFGRKQRRDRVVLLILGPVLLICAVLIAAGVLPI